MKEKILLLTKKTTNYELRQIIEEAIKEVKEEKKHFYKAKCFPTLFPHKF